MPEKTSDAPPIRQDLMPTLIRLLEREMKLQIPPDVKRRGDQLEAEYHRKRFRLVRGRGAKSRLAVVDRGGWS